MCPHCRYFGHNANSCSHKPVVPVNSGPSKVQKTWVPINRPTVSIPVPSTTVASLADEEISLPTPSTVLANNVFSLLANEEEDEMDVLNDLS